MSTLSIFIYLKIWNACLAVQAAHIGKVCYKQTKTSNIRFPSNDKNQAKDRRNKSCEGTLISLNISGKDIADAVQRALHKAKMGIIME